MFFKLDGDQLAEFAAKLAPDIITFNTSTGAVLRSLAARRGWGAALRALIGQVVSPDPEAGALVQGNLDRKRIRVPQIFSNKVVAGIYRRVKVTQAGLLKQALEAEMKAQVPDCSLIFNGSAYPESVLAAVSRTLPRVFVEGGFFPNTLQIDPKGLNGANSIPRSPEFYRVADFASEGLPKTVNNRPSKRQFEKVDLAPGFVFVPFQVPSDMQVTLHSPWVRDMAHFLEVVTAAAEDNPDEVFVIKEHPSFKHSVKNHLPPHPRVIFANGNITSELLEQSRAVMTLNSTVGIEALLHDKPVITLGEACYNIEGLVQRAQDTAALNKALQNRDFRPDEMLRQQFLGYLWNRYLLHGSYNDLPDNLAFELRRRAGQDIIS